MNNPNVKVNPLDQDSDAAFLEDFDDDFDDDFEAETDEEISELYAAHEGEVKAPKVVGFDPAGDEFS